MNKLPPLKTLPVFLAVAKNLSFSKAGEELHVTHSAVSQSIALLESFLGKKLFHRDGNRISITEPGKKYYYEINTAVNIISESTQRQLGASDNNILTVNILSTLAMRWLIARLSSFQSNNPKIDIRLSTLGSKEFNFERDAIDIAIAYGQENDWTGFHKELLFEDFIFPVCSPKIRNIKTAKYIYVTAELRNKDWLLWCKAAQRTEPLKSSRIYFQDTQQALQAAIAGLGIAMTHKPFVINDLQSKQLIMPFDTQLKLPMNYYLIYPDSYMNLPKVQKFKNWIINEIQLSKNKVTNRRK